MHKEKIDRYIKLIVSIFLTVLISYSIGHAWSGLTASDGDTLTYTKWNELMYDAVIGKFVDGTDSDDAVYMSGSVGIGTLAPSNGSGGGGQNLKLDVGGAIGASHYCDEDGLNCTAAADIGSGGGR